MKRLLAIAAVLTGVFSVPAVAGNYPPTPYVVQPFAPSEIPTKLRELVYNMNYWGPGLIYTIPGIITATAAATTQTLASYTLTAGSFNTVGQTIKIRGVFNHVGADTNNITPVLNFGGFSYTGAVNATSGGTEAVECYIERTGVSTQTTACTGMTQVTPLVNVTSSQVVVDTADIVISAQCIQGTAAIDCNLALFTVEAIR